MAPGFLSLASGSSPPTDHAFTMAGPMLMLLVIVLIVLAVCVALLTRFARRRLVDEPTSRKHVEFADPWTEAGKRIAGPRGPSAPGKPPGQPGAGGESGGPAA